MTDKASTIRCHLLQLSEAKIGTERGNVEGPRETLWKSTFVNLICFIWYQGLSVKTTISGFRATWIYLRDKIKCSTNRFHPQLLKHYEHWVPMGKLEYIIEDLATAIKTLQKFNPCQETGAF